MVPCPARTVIIYINMRVIEVSDLSQPGVDVFGKLTEAQLRSRLEPDKGLFIAESPKVINVALSAGYRPV